MRAAALFLLIFAVPCLLAPAAYAQSEDEKILEEPSGEGTDAVPLPDEDIDDEELDEQVFYSGFGVERVSTSFDNLGEATNLKGVIGFRIPTAPWFGLEIDIGQTIIPGEYREPDPGSLGTPTGCGPLLADPCPGTPAEDGAFDGNGEEFAMTALGLSVALKSSGRFYVSGKYGYRYVQTSNDTINEKRSGNGLGIGVGYRWGKGLSGVELGYQELGEDVDSIGLTFFARSRR